MFAGEHGVYADLTPRENLAFLAGLQGIDVRDRRQSHADLLSTLGLSGVADVPVRALSHGQRRRVAFAGTLARETPVLLLDEPTQGLDLEASYAFRGHVRRLAAEQGRTVLLASHDMEAVRETCDRVVVLHGGDVVADEPVERLLGAARSRSYRVTLATDFGRKVRRRLERDHGVERWDEVPEGLRLEVTVDDSAAFYEFVAALRDLEAEVVSVSAVDPGLEDAFLHLTGGTR